MSTGAVIAIVAGVAAVGVVAVVVLKKAPVAAATKPVPRGNDAGSLIAQFGGQLVSRFGSAIGAKLSDSLDDLLA